MGEKKRIKKSKIYHAQVHIPYDQCYHYVYDQNVPIIKKTVYDPGDGIQGSHKC